MSPQISSGDKGVRRWEDRGRQRSEWEEEESDIARECTRMRRTWRWAGKGEGSMVTLESVCDRQAEEEGEEEGRGKGGCARDASWVKAPEPPWFHCERHSAEKIDSVCPLCQGMPKTMTSLSSNYQGHEARAPDSHLDLLFIIIHSLIHHFPCAQTITLRWHWSSSLHT